MRRTNPYIPTAVRIYWQTLELSTKDIEELFGCSRKTANVYKKEARRLQNERGIKSWNPTRVETKTAYDAWGLDIGDLEERYRKLLKNHLLEGEQ